MFCSVLCNLRSNPYSFKDEKHIKTVGPYDCQLERIDYLDWRRESKFFCYHLLVIMWFLLGGVSFSSCCLQEATLFYCGTSCAFHILFEGDVSATFRLQCIATYLCSCAGWYWIAKSVFGMSTRVTRVTRVTSRTARVTLVRMRRRSDLLDYSNPHFT